MNKEDRKAALARYRESARPVGIYALRADARSDGGPEDPPLIWIGRARDLRAIENRLTFTLRQGNCPHASLQAAWSQRGAAAFRFEVLEELDTEELGLALERTLKDRHDHWVARLGAVRIG